MEGMQVGLHQFRSTTIEWLKGALREEGITRNVLTHSLCAHEDWRNRRGQLCISAAAKALPVLASKLGLALPAARSAPNFEADARQAGRLQRISRTLRFGVRCGLVAS